MCAGGFPKVSLPKNSPAAQNEPWEFELPEADPTNADPTPFRRLRAAIPRSTRRPKPVSSRSLSAVPCQSSTHCARLLHSHDHRHHLRRLDPRAPLLMPSLPSHRLAAARVRATLPALQHHGDRAVSHGATPRSPDPRRITAHLIALPARPVLAAPFPLASRSILRRAGRFDQTRTRSRLRPSCTRHAQIHRLDSRSSLPLRQRAPAPVGLAAFAGSRRPPRLTLPAAAPA